MILSKIKTILILALFLLQVIPLKAQQITRGYYWEQKTKKNEVSLPNWKKFWKASPKVVLGTNEAYEKVYEQAWKGIYKQLQLTNHKMLGNPLYFRVLGDTNRIKAEQTFWALQVLKYNHHQLPFIEMIDNFYQYQGSDGSMDAEYPLYYGDLNIELSELSKRSSSIPVAMLEYDYARFSGDLKRVKQVLPNLLAAVNTAPFRGLGVGAEYNKPFPTLDFQFAWPESATSKAPYSLELNNRYLLQLLYLSRIYNDLKIAQEAKFYSEQYREFAKVIDEKFFTIDLQNFSNKGGTEMSNSTLRAFEVLLSKAADEKKVRAMFVNLQGKEGFNSPILWQYTAIKFQEGFKGVSMLENYKVLTGLKNYGPTYDVNRLQTSILNDLIKANEGKELLSGILNANTPSLYPSVEGENGLPEIIAINGLIEFIIGLEVNAIENKVIWNIKRTDEHGIKNFYLGSNKVTLLCKERASFNDKIVVEVKAEQPFTLLLTDGAKTKIAKVQKGKQKIELF